MSNKNFLTSLEDYLKNRLALPFSFYWIVLGVMFVSLLASLFSYKIQRKVLEAGGFPESSALVFGLIEDLARKGDYEQAQRVYEEQKVLGISDSFNIESVVYPEQFLERKAEEIEGFLRENPYYLDGVRVLGEIYKEIENTKRLKELEELGKFIDPEFSF